MPQASAQSGFCIEVLLPLRNLEGERFPENYFDSLQLRLKDEFGRVAVFYRAPAEAFWASTAGTVSEGVVIFEVMAQSVNTEWWAGMRQRLEDIFKQEDIVIRSHPITRL